MAGLDPAIHALPRASQDVDARHKAGHDGFGQHRAFNDPRHRSVSPLTRTSPSGIGVKPSTFGEKA